MADEQDSQFALKFYRNHRREWEACQSVEDAVSSAYWMQEDGHGAPDEVVSLAGPWDSYAAPDDKGNTRDVWEAMIDAMLEEG